MTPTLRCKGCQTALRMRPEYAGKKLRCPRCKAMMNVPAIQPEDPPLLPEDDYAITSGHPSAGFIDPDANADADFDEDDRYESEWVACPRCGTQESERVLWTFWGSFFGPALFHHVRCPQCNTSYNGRTGRSNFIPALIFTVIPLLLIMGLIGTITWIILVRQF